MGKVVTGRMKGVQGRVGGEVFSKGLKGQTIVRDYTPSVRNANTNKQIANRIILATVSQAVKFMEGIIDHSFEGKAFGGESKRYFQSINNKQLRALAAVDFQAQSSNPADWNVLMTTKGVSALIPNKWIISDGSLGSCKLKVQRSNGTDPGDLQIAEVANQPLTLRSLETGEKYVTYGNLLQAAFGLTSTDEQITLVTIQRAAEGARYAFNGGTAPGQVIAYTSMSARRLCVDNTIKLNDEIILTDVDGVLLDNADDAINDAAVRLFADSKSDPALLDMIAATVQLVTTGESGALATAAVSFGPALIGDYTADADGNGIPYAAGIIRSRENGGNWLRSRCVMTLGVPTSAYNFGLDWFSAQQAWNSVSVYAVDGEFLDEGGAGGHIGENFTPAG